MVNENFKYVMYMLYLAENTTFMYMWKYSTHRKDYHAVLDGVMLCHFLTIFGSFAFKVTIKRCIISTKPTLFRVYTIS